MASMRIGCVMERFSGNRTYLLNLMATASLVDGVEPYWCPIEWTPSRLDGETGILVSPDDPDALARALEHLVTDPARRREMGRLAREDAVSRFDGRVNTRRLFEFILRRR